MGEQEQSKSKSDLILGYSELKTLKFYMSAVNECVFTMIFLLTSFNICATAEMHFAYFADSVHIAFAFGLVLAVAHFQASKIYDCHLNPAVSFGLICSGRIPIIRGIIFIIMQTVGGIIGAVRFYNLRTEDKGICCEPIDINMWVAFALEYLTTHFFVYVAAYVAQEERRKKQHIFYSLFYGFAYAAGYLITVSATGGGINPARCIGPAVWMGCWKYQWIFWAAPFLGGLTGAGFCKAFDKGD